MQSCNHLRTMTVRGQFPLISLASPHAPRACSAVRARAEKRPKSKRAPLMQCWSAPAGRGMTSPTTRPGPSSSRPAATARARGGEKERRKDEGGLATTLEPPWACHCSSQSDQNVASLTCRAFPTTRDAKLQVKLARAVRTLSAIQRVPGSQGLVARCSTTECCAAGFEPLFFLKYTLGSNPRHCPSITPPDPSNVPTSQYTHGWSLQEQENSRNRSGYFNGWSQRLRRLLAPWRYRWRLA